MSLTLQAENEEKMLVEGAIPFLVQYLNLNSPTIFQKYASMILVNLSLNEKVRVATRVAGALPLIAGILKSGKEVAQKGTIFCTF
jgi:hypothetical protein